MRVLIGLIEMSEIEVALIVTCRSSPELSIEPEAFQLFASEHQIPYHFTNDLNSPEYEEILRSLHLDLGVAMLWVNTISTQVIESCGGGIVNLHGGALPRYRGNACQSWAILNGETSIGVTCHLMKGGNLDSGPILLQEHFDISKDTSVGEAIASVTEIGARLVLQATLEFLQGVIEPETQDNQRSLYCYPRLPRDGEIDWHQSAESILYLIRAANRPYPGAYSWFQDTLDGGRVKKLEIWKAHLADFPVSEFSAVPGHVIHIKDHQMRGVVTGDNRVIILDNVSLDGMDSTATQIFKSVRQRLGLDVASEIASMRSRLEKMEMGAAGSDGPGALIQVASWFQKNGVAELRSLENEVNQVIKETSKILLLDFHSVRTNPLRNYSFQNRYFQWEDRNVDFGIQIYRSLEIDLSHIQGVSFGYWIITNDVGVVERRIYAGIPTSLSDEEKHSVLKVFELNAYPREITTLSDKHDSLSGLYYVIKGDKPEMSISSLTCIARSSATHSI